LDPSLNYAFRPRAFFLVPALRRYRAIFSKNIQ
jgi:hypothetical protein